MIDGGEEISLAVIADGDIVDSAVDDMECDPSMFVNRGECEGDGYSGCTFTTTLRPQFLMTREHVFREVAS